MFRAAKIGTNVKHLLVSASEVSGFVSILMLNESFGFNY